MTPRLLLLVVLILGSSLPAPAQDRLTLAEAQELLDAGRIDEADVALDRLIRRQPRNAEAYLLRSTAHFMADEREDGERDLDRALELDPTLRQGWLNKAALEMSEEDYEAAIRAFERAQALDPEALDVVLNLGAARLLAGELEAATADFERYLAGHPRSAEAYYLVASNYALAGYEGLALRHLQEAIRLDERIRLRVRTDPNFSDLVQTPRFQEVLNTDVYRPPPEALRAARTYDIGYAAGGGPLLRSVLDALQFLGEPFTPQVEVTPDWALLWGEMRIKVSETERGEGLVEVTSLPDRMRPDEFDRRTKRLFDSILVQLARRTRGE